jgi:CHAT domain-containing protein
MLKLYQEKKVGEQDPFWSEILNYIINTKALILSETNRMVENLRRSKDPEVVKLFTEWRARKNEWAYLSGSAKKKNKEALEGLQYEIVRIEKEMAQKSLPVSQERSSRLQWQQVSSKLKKDEAAIEIARIDVNITQHDSAVVYLAFVIRNGNPHPDIVILSDGRQLEKRYIRYYFNTISQRIEDTLSFTHFWKPLVQALEHVKTVYISADGVFHLINADALQTSLARRFLAQDLSILNMTNIGHLISKKDTRFTFSSAALFGSPDFSKYTLTEKQEIGFGENISALPGTAAEVTQIGRLLTSGKIDVHAFTGEEASELALFNMPGYDVLHLATHGFFNSEAFGKDAMLGSGLVFSKDRAQEKDGILTAYEASNLNLDPTKLVVLSACKTGLGAVKEGEGVYGLQRAFEVSGVDHILMTLWNVDDAVTKEFMVDFYARLISEKNVPLAFKKAQLRLKEKYPDVYYWGAFKLISSF